MWFCSVLYHTRLSQQLNIAYFCGHPFFVTRPDGADEADGPVTGRNWTNKVTKTPSVDIIEVEDSDDELVP